MAIELPEPTAAEFDTLELHISEWRCRTPVEQAVCLAVLRGHGYVPQIAKYLGLKVAVIEGVLPKLIGSGLLWDNHKLLLH